MIPILKGYKDPENAHYVKAYVRMRKVGKEKPTWLVWWAYQEQLTGDMPEKEIWLSPMMQACCMQNAVQFGKSALPRQIIMEVRDQIQAVPGWGAAVNWIQWEMMRAGKWVTRPTPDILVAGVWK